MNPTTDQLYATSSSDFLDKGVKPLVITFTDEHRSLHMWYHDFENNSEYAIHRLPIVDGVCHIDLRTDLDGVCGLDFNCRQAIMMRTWLMNKTFSKPKKNNIRVKRMEQLMQFAKFFQIPSFIKIVSEHLELFRFEDEEDDDDDKENDYNAGVEDADDIYYNNLLEYGHVIPYSPVQIQDSTTVHIGAAPTTVEIVPVIPTTIQIDTIPTTVEIDPAPTTATNAKEELDGDEEEKVNNNNKRKERLVMQQRDAKKIKVNKQTRHWKSAGATLRSFANIAKSNNNTNANKKRKRKRKKRKQN